MSSPNEEDRADARQQIAIYRVRRQHISEKIIELEDLRPHERNSVEQQALKKGYEVLDLCDDIIELLQLRSEGIV